MEMEDLHQNGTWDLVPTWGLSLDRLKAQLVARGHTQTYDIDFEETLSTVANISSIHVLISLVVKHAVISIRC